MDHCYWDEHELQRPLNRTQFLEAIGLRLDPADTRTITRADLAVALHDAAVDCNHYCATAGVLATSESRARHYALHVTGSAAIFAALGRQDEPLRLRDNLARLVGVEK